MHAMHCNVMLWYGMYVCMHACMYVCIRLLVLYSLVKSRTCHRIHRSYARFTAVVHLSQAPQ